MIVFVFLLLLLLPVAEPVKRQINSGRQRPSPRPSPRPTPRLTAAPTPAPRLKLSFAFDATKSSVTTVASGTFVAFHIPPGPVRVQVSARLQIPKPLFFPGDLAGMPLWGPQSQSEFALPQRRSTFLTTLMAKTLVPGEFFGFPVGSEWNMQLSTIMVLLVGNVVGSALVVAAAPFNCTQPVRWVWTDGIVSQQQQPSSWLLFPPITRAIKGKEWPVRIADVAICDKDQRQFMFRVILVDAADYGTIWLRPQSANGDASLAKYFAVTATSSAGVSLQPLHSSLNGGIVGHTFNLSQLSGELLVNVGSEFFLEAQVFTITWFAYNCTNSPSQRPLRIGAPLTICPFFASDSIIVTESGSLGVISDTPVRVRTHSINSETCGGDAMSEATLSGNQNILVSAGQSVCLTAPNVSSLVGFNSTAAFFPTVLLVDRASTSATAAIAVTEFHSSSTVVAPVLGSVFGTLVVVAMIGVCCLVVRRRNIRLQALHDTALTNAVASTPSPLHWHVPAVQHPPAPAPEVTIDAVVPTVTPIVQPAMAYVPNAAPRIEPAREAETEF
jgi:hypothetical protein